VIVAAYTYDGLGRLIQKNVPGIPTVAVHFVYDGVRRITEEVAPFVSGQPFNFAVDREYLYGPDYVDEHIAQLAPDPAGVAPDTVLYTPQDANYNVTALLNAYGDVLEQYAYTPYGQIVARDDLTAPGDPPTPINSVGHQGLFFDRYNFSANPLTDSPFDTAALGLYYNRNRFYSPTLGRYLRNDPNASGAPLIMANGFHASAPFADVASFDALTLYADSMNLFTHLGNNPVMFNDPTGLSLNRITDTLVAVTFAYAIGIDAIIVSQLDDGPASSNIDAAIRVLPFMLSGALAGGLTGSSAIAGGVTGAGTGLGFAAGFAIGAAYDVGFSIVGAGFRAGLGSSAAGLGRRLLGRVLRFRGAASSLGKSFKSFSAFKRAAGPAGAGKQWHHIVEQNKIGQFGAQRIHSTTNIVAVPVRVHTRISAHYSSKLDFTGGKTVREWLRGKSFEEQFQYGLDIMRRFGG